MKIIRVSSEDEIKKAAKLAGLLCIGHEYGELEGEFSNIVPDPDNELFLASVDNEAVGFAHVSLRRDYVEGTETSPVGYLEGIYVLPKYRRHGCALALLFACEGWAREKGCFEFASDMEEGNDLSYAFHMGAGFKEVNRIVCFTKKL